MGPTCPEHGPMVRPSEGSPSWECPVLGCSWSCLTGEPAADDWTREQRVQLEVLFERLVAEPRGPFQGDDGERRAAVRRWVARACGRLPHEHVPIERLTRDQCLRVVNDLRLMRLEQFFRGEDPLPQPRSRYRRPAPYELDPMRDA